MTFFSIRGTMWPKTNGFQVLVCVLIYVRGRLVLREQCVKMGKVPHKKQKAKLWTGQTEYHDSKLQPTRCNVSWFISFYRRSTCFRRFLCPSSGVHNCTYSFRYCQPILLLAATMEELEPISSIGWQYLKLYVQLCAPDDGQRNRLKHVQRL